MWRGCKDIKQPEASSKDPPTDNHSEKNESKAENIGKNVQVSRSAQCKTDCSSGCEPVREGLKG